MLFTLAHVVKVEHAPVASFDGWQGVHLSPLLTTGRFPVGYGPVSKWIWAGV